MTQWAVPAPQPESYTPNSKTCCPRTPPEPATPPLIIYGHHHHQQPVLHHPRTLTCTRITLSPIQTPNSPHTPTHIPIYLPPSPIYKHPYTHPQLIALNNIYSRYTHINHTFIYDQYAKLTYPLPYPLLPSMSTHTT